MKFIKIKDVVLNDFRNINIEQIVSISENECLYTIRMSNADAYKIEKKSHKKLIDEVLGNAELQLPSERITKRTDRSLQRPTK